VGSNRLGSQAILIDMAKKLEEHRIFPYIAWATVIAFAYFTYTLTTSVQTDLDNLSESVSRVETSLNEIKADRARMNESSPQ